MMTASKLYNNYNDALQQIWSLKWGGGGGGGLEMAILWHLNYEVGCRGSKYIYYTHYVLHQICSLSFVSLWWETGLESL